MAYMLQWEVSVCYVPDGAGPLTQASMQKIVFRPATWPVGPGPVGVLTPGANAPSLANFNTAMTGSSATPAAGSMAADLNTQIAAALTRIQGFATGGG